ncbi:MAG TPA: tol-pal system protein YbgF [Steroidobacteraceae bacterium]
MRHAALQQAYRLLLYAAAAALLMVAGCTSTRADEDPTQIKINDIDMRLARVEQIVSNKSLIELAQRLDSLQADVRTLRGQLEELQNGSESGRKAQRDLYADLDKRLAALESASGAPRAASAPAAPASAASGGTGAPASTAEQVAYGEAFAALKAASYPRAINGFRQFLATYPTSELASNAQYWLGEAYYVTRDYDNAAAAFERVGQQWPNSRKAADALVKLGFTQVELNHLPAARATLAQVGQKYPGSDAAKLANDRLQKLPQ